MLRFKSSNHRLLSRFMLICVSLRCQVTTTHRFEAQQHQKSQSCPNLQTALAQTEVNKTSRVISLYNELQKAFCPLTSTMISSTLSHFPLRSVCKCFLVASNCNMKTCLKRFSCFQSQQILFLQSLRLVVPSICFKFALAKAVQHWQRIPILLYFPLLHGCRSIFEFCPQVHNAFGHHAYVHVTLTNSGAMSHHRWSMGDPSGSLQWCPDLSSIETRLG